MVTAWWSIVTLGHRWRLWRTRLFDPYFELHRQARAKNEDRLVVTLREIDAMLPPHLRLHEDR